MSWRVHQYPVYLIVMLLLLCVYLLRQKVLRLLLIAVLAVFSGLVISDFVVMRELNARVIISEILSFTDGLADSSDIIIHFFRREFGILTLLFAVILSLAVITAVRRGNAAGKTNYRKFRYAVVLTGSALIAAMPTLWLLDSGNSSIFDYKFRNILEVSGAGAKRNYLKPFTKAPGPVPSLTMEKGLGAHRNVIIILTESLSSYQSKFFGGLSDGTPRIDRIAEESLAFTNHHSNGYNTAVIRSIIIRILERCIYIILRCIILCIYVHRIIIPCDNFITGIAVEVYSFSTHGRMTIVREFNNLDTIAINHSAALYISIKKDEVLTVTSPVYRS